MGILVNDNIEVTHHEVRKVVACHLVEQLVLVDAVGLVGQHEHILDITFETQRIHHR